WVRGHDGVGNERADALANLGVAECRWPDHQLPEMPRQSNRQGSTSRGARWPRTLAARQNRSASASLFAGQFLPQIGKPFEDLGVFGAAGGVELGDQRAFLGRV